MLSLMVRERVDRICSPSGRRGVAATGADVLKDKQMPMGIR